MQVEVIGRVLKNKIIITSIPLVLGKIVSSQKNKQVLVLRLNSNSTSFPDSYRSHNYWLSLFLKTTIIFSLSPINRTIERFLLKKVIKRKRQHHEILVGLPALKDQGLNDVLRGFQDVSIHANFKCDFY